MSSPLFSSRATKLPFRVHNISVRYVVKEVSSGSDPAKETLRRVLYPSNLRNKPTPTGTWRPDVGRALQHAIPSVQAHETIERAWLLYQRRLRKRRETALSLKFERMKEAMDELEKLDKTLYHEANKTEDPRIRSHNEKELMKQLRTTERKALDSRIRGLFPRELGLPTDTPPRNGWNYEWTPSISASS